jgi:hypothetical protein
VKSADKLLAIIFVCVAVVLVAMALNMDGCNQTASVTCHNGLKYSTSEWGAEPNLSPRQAEEFCEGKEP